MPNFLIIQILLSMSLKLEYKIRYVTLPARTIYNYVGPWDWRDSDERRKKRSYIYDRAIEWHDNLEKDIIRNGIKNPISIVSGKISRNDWLSLPDYAKKSQLICNLLGGSRLFVAQKLDMMIPCIVSDFTGRFADSPEIFQAADIKRLFANPPERIIYSKHGLDLRTMPGNNDK